MIEYSSINRVENPEFILYSSRMSDSIRNRKTEAQVYIHPDYINMRIVNDDGSTEELLMNSSVIKYYREKSSDSLQRSKPWVDYFKAKNDILSELIEARSNLKDGRKIFVLINKYLNKYRLNAR
jgi:hypothetical protein